MRLTSVGHKDLQACVLKQVSSGEHGSDFTEHPFAVQALCVRQDLLGINQKFHANLLGSPICDETNKNTNKTITSLAEVMTCSYFSVSVFEGSILFVNFKVDLGGSDGQSTSSHHHRSD